jgi:signal transduction histidine kinase
MASVPDLVTRPAAGHTVSMKARLTAAGLRHDPAPSAVASEPAAASEPASVRVAQARSRARERGDAQRQALRPLGVVFIAIVVTASVQTHPAPGLQGAGLGVAAVLIVYAAAVATAISVRWARRGPAAQAGVAVLIGGCGVALAVLQPHGPVEIAPSMGVWIAAVRMPPAPAAATSGLITAALAIAIGLTEHPAAQSIVPAVLLCLLLAVTGQFIRRGRESQDRTELLMAQLQDAREAEAEAAALAERSRIAGELHDVLAHSLSALAIQLQGARKLAAREQVSDGLRTTIERSAELTKAGLADARQAVGALRGDRLPTLDQLSALVEDFRRDTGADATLRIDGTRRALPAEASLALFRGAQEALTNISRYAPGAVTSVIVSYQPGRTVVTVEDHARTQQAAASKAKAALLAEAGGGHGLAAMAERAQRAGGAARAGPTADGWLVELEVPA